MTWLSAFKTGPVRFASLIWATGVARVRAIVGPMPRLSTTEAVARVHIASSTCLTTVTSIGTRTRILVTTLITRPSSRAVLDILRRPGSAIMPLVSG